mmetsp:Transcript_3033/g.8860  ORF Transcript_3033/g.8860 Transcript_3033/m.8860 type:complete len:212 (+) Transcript_3033:761-1396(+)
MRGNTCPFQGMELPSKPPRTATSRYSAHRSSCIPFNTASGNVAASSCLPRLALRKARKSARNCASEHCCRGGLLLSGADEEEGTSGGGDASAAPLDAAAAAASSPSSAAPSCCAGDAVPPSPSSSSRAGGSSVLGSRGCGSSPGFTAKSANCCSGATSTPASSGAANGTKGRCGALKAACMAGPYGWPCAGSVRGTRGGRRTGAKWASATF